MEKDHVKKGQQKGKKNNKQNIENKKKQKQIEKWQRVPLKDGESHEKKHNLPLLHPPHGVGKPL
jgi:hypothetical protein